MVLKLVNPVDASEFNRINLRVYINHAVGLATHNANDITEEAIGDYMETFAVGGGMYSYLNLTSAYYADADGMVRQIVFRFLEDCKQQYYTNGEPIYNGDTPVRDTFHFISYNVSQETLVTKDSFTIKDTPDAYEIAFAFNKGGEALNNTLDMSLVKFNGYTFAQILSECTDATAGWKVVKGVYQLQLVLPKAYTGNAQVKNPTYSYAGNNMQVIAGLIFPNGERLENSYTCHLYANEKIVDCDMVGEYEATKVQRVEYGFVQDSGNIVFTVYFDKSITSSLYVHVCETEQWRSTELYKASKENYDANISKVFVDGGYKTSLLDNILINGHSVGEWHAYDSLQSTNVQVHYGKEGFNSIDIVFAKGCPNTYNDLAELVTAGEGVTVEIRSGLKFMVQTETKETQSFVLKNGQFAEVTTAKPLHVYFDGQEVTQDQTITVQAETSIANVQVEGPLEYSVEATKNGNTTEYTVKYDGDNVFKFTVVEDLVVVDSKTDLLGGCLSQVRFGSVCGIALAMAAATAICVRRKENEEKFDR